jgi:hypothetical protein
VEGKKAASRPPYPFGSWDGIAVAADRSLPPLRRIAVKPRTGKPSGVIAPRYKQGASSTKGKTRKRKEMKAIFLSFVFNNFLESGLFNALRLIQIKKIGSLSNSRPQVVARLAQTTLRNRRAGVSFYLQKCIPLISGFVNNLLLAESRA